MEPYEFAEQIEARLMELGKADAIPAGGLGHWVAQAWPPDDYDIEDWVACWLETIATAEVS